MNDYGSALRVNQKIADCTGSLSCSGLCTVFCFDLPLSLRCCSCMSAMLCHSILGVLT